ncbi:MAG: hypothetical protein GY801_52390 [bacterium]|nr:hypothetical protein [bacterium]
MRLPKNWELPDQITQRFGQKKAGRQRAMIADGHLLLVLHSLPDPETEQREAVFFWRKPEGEWLCSRRGEGLHALRRHLESFHEAEEQFSQAYEQAEDAEDYFHILDRMAPLHHAAKNLHSTLQSAREGISQDRDIIDLRDSAYELERSLDLLYSDAKNALDFRMARQAEEQAKIGMQAVQTGHRLNILAAIFFPITAIAGIFGMNLQHGFENAPLGAFWGVFLFGLILGLLTKKWVLK